MRFLLCGMTAVALSCFSLACESTSDGGEGGAGGGAGGSGGSAGEGGAGSAGDGGSGGFGGIAGGCAVASDEPLVGTFDFSDALMSEDGVVHLYVDSENRIERLDLRTKQWLAPLEVRFLPLPLN